MWGLLAGFARQQPPLLPFAREIPNELHSLLLLGFPRCGRIFSQFVRLFTILRPHDAPRPPLPCIHLQYAPL
jgi:hypothetical protein